MSEQKHIFDEYTDALKASREKREAADAAIKKWENATEVFRHRRVEDLKFQGSHISSKVVHGAPVSVDVMDAPSVQELLKLLEDFHSASDRAKEILARMTPEQRQTIGG